MTDIPETDLTQGTDPEVFQASMAALPGGDVELRLYHNGVTVARTRNPGLMPLVDAARREIAKAGSTLNSKLQNRESVAAVVRGPDGKVKPRNGAVQ